MVSPLVLAHSEANIKQTYIDYSELVDEQDRELEAILSHLDITDGNLEDPYGFPKRPGHQSTPTMAICDGCGEQDCMIPLEGFQVCFCCGWSTG